MTDGGTCGEQSCKRAMRKELVDDDDEFAVDETKALLQQARSKDEGRHQRSQPRCRPR